MDNNNYYIEIESTINQNETEPTIKQNGDILTQRFRTFIVNNDSIQINNAEKHLLSLTPGILDDVMRIIEKINNGYAHDNVNKFFGSLMFNIFEVDDNTSSDLFSFIDVNSENQLSALDMYEINTLIHFFKIFFNIIFKGFENTKIQISNVDYFYAYLRYSYGNTNISGQYRKLIQIRKYGGQVYVTEYMTDYILLLRQSQLINEVQYKKIMEILGKINNFLNQILNASNNLYIYSRQVRHVIQDYDNDRKNTNSNINNNNNNINDINVGTQVYAIIPQNSQGQKKVKKYDNIIIEEEEVIDVNDLETIQVQTYQEQVTEEELRQQVQNRVTPFLIDAIVSYCYTFVKGVPPGLDYLTSINNFISNYLPSFPLINLNPIPYLTSPLPIFTPSGGSSQLATVDSAQYKVFSVQVLGIVSSVVASYFAYEVIYNGNDNYREKLEGIISIMDNQIVPELRVFGNYSPQIFQRLYNFCNDTIDVKYPTTIPLIEDITEDYNKFTTLGYNKFIVAKEEVEEEKEEEKKEEKKLSTDKILIITGLMIIVGTGVILYFTKE